MIEWIKPKNTSGYYYAVVDGQKINIHRQSWWEIVVDGATVGRQMTAPAAKKWVAENLPKRVTDCCGRLLPAFETLVNDVHYIEMCSACRNLDGSEHESHVTCRGECPGSDWVYVRSDSSSQGSPASPVGS